MRAAKTTLTSSARVRGRAADSSAAQPVHTAMHCGVMHGLCKATALLSCK